MEHIHHWHNDTLGRKVVKALEKNQFHAIYVDTKEEAENFIMYHIKSGDNIAFGGSQTIKAMNLKRKIRELGGNIIDHGEEGLNKEEKLSVMRKELISDLFLCSSNAITLDGKLVNIDGAGNRVAAMSFGPKKVIIVAGINKIVENVEEGFKRIQNNVAPKNCKRLGVKNPCVIEGTCVNCNSQSRICRISSVITKRPMQSDISVIIVGEELGY
ncbi:MULTISPECIES: lactate utilization protein [Clostridium]|uniref:Lactate utilization protein n=1 Tax=Clostridium senegalense TaxID=1465809 RepID=A0A6M0H5L8_9CLOT|nr:MULTISPECIES: lactate utilization protein [Clostridium]NEU04892.1 lactate utilization protein [Clostridium senegalense]